MSTCPRCGEDIGPGQEYCLECGTRIPGPHLHSSGQDPGRGWVRRALLGLAVAVAGAAVAVAATGRTEGEAELVTATGGFASTPAPETTTTPGGAQDELVEWPPTQEGWTIALATLPQAGGKKEALARAREARSGGLETVGVLDTSRYASLHPGYWLVFSGMYTSEAEATSSLRPARAFARTAAVRRIVA